MVIASREGNEFNYLSGYPRFLDIPTNQQQAKYQRGEDIHAATRCVISNRGGWQPGWFWFFIVVFLLVIQPVKYSFPAGYPVKLTVPVLI